MDNDDLISIVNSRVSCFDLTDNSEGYFSSYPISLWKAKRIDSGRARPDAMIAQTVFIEPQICG